MRQEHHALLDLFEVLGQRWTLRVLWELRDEPLTYRALLARCGGMSSSVLTGRLRELRAEGMVEHTGEGYTLSATARAGLPVMVELGRWARTWQAGRAGPS